MLGTMNSREMGCQRPGLHSSAPSSLMPWEVDHRVPKRWQVTADPSAQYLSFQKESFKSGLIQESIGCDSQLCCWVLSLLILQDRALLCPLFQEKTKWGFDSFHCGCPAAHGQDRGLGLMADTQTPEALCPKPRALPTPWKLPLPWAIPLRLGILTRLHEQPSEHGLLLQPVEQAPVGGHTPRLNTAPAGPPPPAVAGTQVTKHILALGALVPRLLPGRSLSCSTPLSSGFPSAEPGTRFHSSQNVPALLATSLPGCVAGPNPTVPCPWE